MSDEPVGAPTHLDLLAAAGAVRLAAASRDVDRLHDELTRLRNSVVEHLHGERQATSVLRQPAAAVVRQGQERLLELLDELLFSADGDGDPCRCLARAVDLGRRLRRQARLEAALLAGTEHR